MKIPDTYWEIGIDNLIHALETSPSGISEEEAGKRLSEFGHNILKKREKRTKLSLFLSQFKSPIILILIFATLVSAIVRDFTNAAIIVAIISISGFLSFLQKTTLEKQTEQLSPVHNNPYRSLDPRDSFCSYFFHPGFSTNTKRVPSLSLLFYFRI
jgi:Mg2+-importing ATPase